MYDDFVACFNYVSKLYIDNIKALEHARSHPLNVVWFLPSDLRDSVYARVIKPVDDEISSLRFKIETLRMEALISSGYYKFSRPDS